MNNQLTNNTADSINRFQFALYQQLSKADNLIYSRLGLYFVLALLHEGARGKTRTLLTSSGPTTEPVVLTIDRPFLYTVVDRPTGVILFAGKVINPTG